MDGPLWAGRLIIAFWEFGAVWELGEVWPALRLSSPLMTLRMLRRVNFRRRPVQRTEHPDAIAH